MNTLSARILVVSAFVTGATLSACGKGDEVLVTPVAAGEDCANGGVRITVNDESHLSCHGDPETNLTSESVAANAPGNPCIGPALKMTIHKRGQSPTEAWICQELKEEDVSAIGRVLGQSVSLEYNRDIIWHELLLECTDPDDSVERDRIRMYAQVTEIQSRRMQQCAWSESLAIPELSAKENEVVECLSAGILSLLDCERVSEGLDGEPLDRCDDSQESLDRVTEAIDDCTYNLPSFNSCAEGLSDEEKQAFNQRMSLFGPLIVSRCTSMGGGPL